MKHSSNHPNQNDSHEKEPRLKFQLMHVPDSIADHPLIISFKEIVKIVDALVEIIDEDDIRVDMEIPWDNIESEFPDIPETVLDEIDTGFPEEEFVPSNAPSFNKIELVYMLLISNLEKLMPHLIVGIESENWLMAMNEAAMVRQNAAALHAATFIIGDVMGIDEEYTLVLRYEMDNFKEHYRDWVKTFKNFEIDEEIDTDDWGLFHRTI